MKARKPDVFKKWSINGQGNAYGRGVILKSEYWVMHRAIWGGRDGRDAPRMDKALVYVGLR